MLVPDNHWAADIAANRALLLGLGSSEPMLQQRLKTIESPLLSQGHRLPGAGHRVKRMDMRYTPFLKEALRAMVQLHGCPRVKAPVGGRGARGDGTRRWAQHRSGAGSAGMPASISSPGRTTRTAGGVPCLTTLCKQAGTYSDILDATQHTHHIQDPSTASTAQFPMQPSSSAPRSMHQGRHVLAAGHRPEV